MAKTLHSQYRGPGCDPWSGPRSEQGPEQTGVALQEKKKNKAGALGWWARPAEVREIGTEDWGGAAGSGMGTVPFFSPCTSIPPKIIAQPRPGCDSPLSIFPVVCVSNLLFFYL